MSMNRFLLSFTAMITLGMVSLGNICAFPFVPFSLAAVSLPFLGKTASAASSAKGNVDKTLTQVDDLILYVKVFLLFATALLLIVFVAWALRAIRRSRRRKKCLGVLKVLHRVQSDLAFLKGAAAGIKKHKLVEQSKRDAITILSSLVTRRFFRKKLGVFTHGRMIESFALIQAGTVDLEGQEVLVDQWIKAVSFLAQ